MDHLRPDQLAELLCLSKRTIYRAIQEKWLETIQIRGNTWVKVPEEVREMKLGDKMLRPSDVAKTLAVSRSTIYRWFWEGRLSGCSLNGQTLRIYESSVNFFISEAEKLAGELGSGPVEDINNPTLRKQTTPKEDSRLAAVVRLAVGIKRKKGEPQDS